ncbi:helix-turn-helix domain-containing protein [Oceanospirillaceae bacterium ASx5O]|nr:helix-turn-helix domain-containing protein [Oceanospirillaceae bacterium ASx5O]
MNTVAERVKDRRLVMGITQKELGDMVGASDVTVSKWESGTNQPKGRYVIALSKALGVTPEWLLGRGDEGRSLSGKTTRSTEITVKGKCFGLETNGQELAIQFIGQSTTGWLRIDIADTSMTIYNGNCYLDTGAMLFGPIDNEASKQICGLIAPWIAPFVNQAMGA